MYSPELALARDFIRRGALIIPLVWLAMFGLMLWIMMWLVSDARVDPDAQEAIVLHVTLTLVMGLGAAVAVLQSHGKLSRFFARPITTTRLVASQMAFGMVTIALMYGAAVGLLNLTGVQWPILGPALFLATVLACSLAVIWTFEGTVVGQLMACSAVSGPLVIWFNRCYGARIMGDWHVMWHRPSATEALTLGAISLAAFGVAVLGVQRTRRGDWFTLEALVNRWREYRASGSAMVAFASASAAQLWYEWRAKFGVVPACVLAFAFLATAVGWGTGYLPTDELLGFSLGVPSVLLVAVIPMVYGLVAGNCGREAKSPMQHFLATRPVTDAFLANAILSNCAWALAGAWAMWLVGIAILAGLLFLIGQGPETLNQIVPARSPAPVLVYLGMPTISWIITSCMATLVATGRPRWWAVGLSLVFGLFIGFVTLREFVSPAVYSVITDIWLASTAFVYLLSTAACYLVALRRKMLRPTTAMLAMAASLLFSATVLAVLYPHVPDVIWLGHIAAFLSLAILPFAGLPLAVRWNRHR